MGSRIYSYEFRCPHCGAETLFETGRTPPPPIVCGTCLRDLSSVNELEIVRLHVIKGAST